MDQFFEGIIACMAVLGGLCGFIYWVFGIMEKRIETKLDIMASDIARIVTELRDERRSNYALYKFLMDNY